MSKRPLTQFFARTVNQLRPWRKEREWVASQPEKIPSGASVADSMTSVSDNSDSLSPQVGLEEPFVATDGVGVVDASSNVPLDQARGKTGGGKGFWGLTVTWLILLLLSGGTSIGAFLWMASLPPVPKCDAVSQLSSDWERLECAQQATQSGDLEALLQAYALVENWTPDHPLYTHSRRLMKDWSKGVLAVARQKIYQSDLEKAIAIARKIPPDSPGYNDAEVTIASWRKGWDSGETLYATIQTDLKAQKWQEAANQAEGFSSLSSDYWRLRLGDVKDQIAREQEARKQLQRAIDLAMDGAPDALAQATIQARKISPKSYAYTDAQANISKWNRTLLKLATDRLLQQDGNEAIVIAKNISPRSELAPQALQLIQIAQAQKLAMATPAQLAKQSVSNQLWTLWSATNAVRSMDKSPIYQQFQPYVARWETQIEDLTQLQMANSLAALGQIPTLQLAIQQAKTIAPQRLYRLQAQTLILQWQKDIQRIEDRPTLSMAQDLAASGKTADLKAAIAQAKKIAPRRALRRDADKQIARWYRQIQTLEDQPLLQKAQTLAESGKLRAAIQLAAKIGSKRALYQDARTAIDEWTTQAAIAEDQILLSKATTQAEKGNLTTAIQIAVQIAPGRPLYYDAQNAIDRWLSERDAIQTANQAPSAYRSYNEAAPVVNTPPDPAPIVPPAPEPAPIPEPPIPDPLPPLDPAPVPQN